MRHLVILLFCVAQMISVNAWSQCAMCKKAAEDAGGINEGILYIMVFPYIILSVIGTILFLRWKKIKKATNS